MKNAILFLLCFPFGLLAQTPFPPLPPAFRDDVVPRVDIFLPPDSLAWMLTPGEYHWHATFVFDNGELKDTLQNVGVKIRGNTSVWAQKKSIRVSFNTYEPGRTWQGLEKLNLNGSHNDPTVARTKVSWDLLRRMGLPGPRSNHVELYLNGQYFGLYINVEHIDERYLQLRFGHDEGNLYKCLWPADLAYKGSNPDLYKEEFNGRRAYALVTNETADNYTDLAHFISILNTTSTPDLPCALEGVFNVDEYLKVAAFDILDGNWDNAIYNKNNFYLYHNPATDRFEYIPYDLDNTLGIDWFDIDWASRNIYSWAPSGEERPLYKRLMQVPEYKDRFTHYMSGFLNEVFHADSLFPYLDNLRTLISPSAEADPYRPLDYGFSMDDFEEGWEDELPFFHTPEGIKSYITLRRTKATWQLAPGDFAPVTHFARHQHSPNDAAIAIQASVMDNSGIASVQVCHRWNEQAQTCTDLHDDGLHNDGLAGDGLFGGSVETVGQTGRFEYHITANDDAGQEARHPLCGWQLAYVGEGFAPLAINEIMASNTDTYPDEAGEFEDWVEIYNRTEAPVSLENFYLTDDEALPAKWRMPNIWLQPHDFLVFWADSDESQGLRHTNFKLSAGGEHLAIYEKQGNSFTLVDGLTFGEQESGQTTGRLPDGLGEFQSLVPTPAATNQPPLGSGEAGGSVSGIALSPNPASDKFAVSLEGGAQAMVELELLNAQGVSLWRKSLAGSRSEEVSVEGWPAGVYFLKARTVEGGAIWGRVLVSQK